MPAPLLLREEVVARLTDVFRDRTYDGASLSELSKATGLGKSSLYHYFPGGKEEMGRAVLDHALAAMTDLLESSLTAKGTPRSRLQQMVRGLSKYYEDGNRACLLGNLSRGTARQTFQTELSVAFHSWIDRIAALVREVGFTASVAQQRAEDAVALVQGGLVVSAGLSRSDVFIRLMRRLPAQLLQK